MRSRTAALAAAWIAAASAQAGAAAPRPGAGGPMELRVESADRDWSARTCEALAGLARRLELSRDFCRPAGAEVLRLSVDGESLALTLDAGAPDEARRALAESVAALGFPAVNGASPDDLRAAEVLFAAGLTVSERLELLHEGRYLDRFTGRVLDFPGAWGIYQTELPPTPRPFRAWAGLGAALGVGALWYGTEASLNRKDWQYADIGESLEAKFLTFEGWRFDDNRMWLNSPGHVLAGAAYYQVGRAADLGPVASLGAAAATSAAWELFVEYREVMAFPDVIFGSLGAAAFGEAAWQLGALFAAADDVPLYRLLSWAFAGPGALDRWLDGRPPAQAPALGLGGLPADTWHELRLSLGGAATESADGRERNALALGVDTELVPLPAWRRPVTSRRWARGPLRTRLSARVLTDDDGVQDFLLRANVVYLGRHDQAMRPGEAVGHALLAGLAVDWRQRNRSGEDFLDRHAVLGLTGPVVNLVLLLGGAELRLGAEAYPDFAMVQARGYPAWRGAHDAAGVRSVLRDQGYYYAWGGSASARAEVRWQGLRLGARLALDRFESFDVLDRRQEEVTADLHLSDGRTELRAWVGAPLPAGLGDLRVTLEDWESWGEVREAGRSTARGSSDEVRVVGEWVATF